MKKYIGLWIDHEKAYIVTVAGEQVTTSFLESEVEGRSKPSAGSRSKKSPYGPQDVSSERKTEGRRGQQLSRYYREVMGIIGDADRVLIFGPGEARIELEKEIKKSKQFAARVMAVEPADKMTENQMAAKVKKFFAPYLDKQY